MFSEIFCANYDTLVLFDIFFADEKVNLMLKLLSASVPGARLSFICRWAGEN